MEDIYELELGRSKDVGVLTFFRVPGGWIIGTYDDEGINITSTTFVPYNEEFLDTIPSFAKL